MSQSKLSRRADKRAVTRDDIPEGQLQPALEDLLYLMTAWQLLIALLRLPVSRLHHHACLPCLPCPGLCFLRGCVPP